MASSFVSIDRFSVKQKPQCDAEFRDDENSSMKERRFWIKVFPTSFSL